MPRVGFLGLGLMGFGMARRVLDAGYPLAVYNRTPDKAAALVADGARLAESPRDAADGADIIFSMVADDEASRAVWLGVRGAATHAKAGCVLIESGTLTGQWIAELASIAMSRECNLLDAPVMGSKVAANSGQLTFLVGGASDALEYVRPVLATMSRAIAHVGPSGSGMVLKLIINSLIGVQTAALAEALVLIERTGLDRDTALAVLTSGVAGNPLMKILSLRMTTGEYAPNFHLGLMAKDLWYAVREASDRNLVSTMAAAALDAFNRATTEGYGEHDYSAVIESIRAQVET